MLQLIAITHQEWLQWIADGHLRCGDRIRTVPDRDSVETLDALLASAPAFSPRDDQAIIFAQLIQRGGTTSNAAQAVVKLEFVLEFFPLNGRGAQLIEGDARRANVRLSSPYLSQAFDNWRDSQLKHAAHDAGLRFVESAGYPCRADTGIRPPQPADVDAWKQKGLAKFEKRRNDRSFGCRIALSILEGQVDEQTWGQIKSRWGTPSFPKDPDAAQIGSRSVCDWPWFRKQAQTVRDYLEGIGKPFPLVQQAALAYWRDRLESQDGAGLERQAELDALARDLRIIEADEGIDRAIEAAYLLGRIARRDTVNQLYYATHHGDFPSLCVQQRDGWLCERVPSIQELSTSGVEIVERASISPGMEAIEGLRSPASSEEADDQRTMDESPTLDASDSMSKHAQTPVPVESKSESSPTARSEVPLSTVGIPMGSTSDVRCTSQQGAPGDPEKSEASGSRVD